MEKYHFATIITKNHIDKSLALYNSLNNHNPTILHILLVDGTEEDKDILQNLKEDVYFYIINDISTSQTTDILQQLVSKYGHGIRLTNQIDDHDHPDIKLKNITVKMHALDALRWSLKSVFALFLLTELPLITYTDCDLYFYEDYKFLIDQLKPKSILLSPHWRTIHPYPDNDEYKYNYLHGLYNAGYIGLTTQAIPMLHWWANLCYQACTFNYDHGVYVDQRYLDVVPIYFDNVEIIRHQGCNIAAWNMLYLTRKEQDGKTYINDKYPIIFIHYSPITISSIERNLDPHLSLYHKQYKNELRIIRTDLKKKQLGRYICDVSQIII